MIVQPHDTLATDQPTSTQRTLHHEVLTKCHFLESHCVVIKNPARGGQKA